MKAVLCEANKFEAEGRSTAAAAASVSSPAVYIAANAIRFNWNRGPTFCMSHELLICDKAMGKQL